MGRDPREPYRERARANQPDGRNGPERPAPRQVARRMSDPRASAAPDGRSGGPSGPGSAGRGGPPSKGGARRPGSGAGGGGVIRPPTAVGGPGDGDERDSGRRSRPPYGRADPRSRPCDPPPPGRVPGHSSP